MIRFPAYFTGFGSKSDGSARISFATQELSDQDFAELKRNLNAFGYLLFQENEISTKDIPAEPAEEDKNKSPSKRQKAVLFLIWKQGGSVGDFNNYYRERMEKNIERLKTELD